MPEPITLPNVSNRRLIALARKWNACTRAGKWIKQTGYDAATAWEKADVNDGWRSWVLFELTQWDSPFFSVALQDRYIAIKNAHERAKKRVWAWWNANYDDLAEKLTAGLLDHPQHRKALQEGAARRDLVFLKLWNRTELAYKRMVRFEEMQHADPDA